VGLYDSIEENLESGIMPNGIEVMIEFIISAVTLVTGIILYGYSPAYTSAQGQLIITNTGTTGVALAIVGLFFFGVAVYTLTTTTLD